MVSEYGNVDNKTVMQFVSSELDKPRETMSHSCNSAQTGSMS